MNLIRNLILILSSLFIIACASSFKEKCTGPNCSIKSAEHLITYSRKGTRSEAKHGHLTIDNRKIPDVFSLVISGGKTYKFHQRKFMWGLDGYFPVEFKKEDIIKISSNKISLQDIQKGWYMGKEVREDTPSDWFYAEWDSGSAFIAPDAIAKIILEFDLKKIPRCKRPILQKACQR